MSTRTNKKNYEIENKNLIKTEWSHPELSDHIQKNCTCKNCGRSVDITNIFLKQKIITYF
jgi:hypothetical protein